MYLVQLIDVQNAIKKLVEKQLILNKKEDGEIKEKYKFKSSL